MVLVHDLSQMTFFNFGESGVDMQAAGRVAKIFKSDGPSLFLLKTQRKCRRPAGSRPSPGLPNGAHWIDSILENSPLA